MYLTTTSTFTGHCLGCPELAPLGQNWLQSHIRDKPPKSPSFSRTLFYFPIMKDWVYGSCYLRTGDWREKQREWKTIKKTCSEKRIRDSLKIAHFSCLDQCTPFKHSCEFATSKVIKEGLHPLFQISKASSQPLDYSIPLLFSHNYALAT
jgi:hypothetical protein